MGTVKGELGRKGFWEGGRGGENWTILQALQASCDLLPQTPRAPTAPLAVVSVEGGYIFISVLSSRFPFVHRLISRGVGTLKLPSLRVL